MSWREVGRDLECGSQVSIVVTETPLNPSGRGDDSITYNTSPGSHTIFAQNSPTKGGGKT